MSDTILTLLIHHGGRFHNNKKCRYVGGKVTKVCEDLDIDRVSYPEIMSYVKEDLGYDLESIVGLHYFDIHQGDFLLVQDDRTILNIANRLCSGAKLEFYVNHKNVENHISNPIQKDVTGVGGINRGEHDIVDEVSQQSHLVDDQLNIQGSQIMVQENNDMMIEDGALFDDIDLENGNYVDDELPLQSFDNLNIEVDFLTDNDDDELQHSRENVRAFKKKNMFSMEQNKSNGEDDNHGVSEENAYIDGIMAEAKDYAYIDDIMAEPEHDEVYILESDNDSAGSFYYDTDDNCSYYSETYEECGDQALRRPSNVVQFDPMAVISVFCCGMVFQNVQECRDALAKYAIMKSLQIHFIKNDKVGVRAGCMEKCPWKFLASQNGHNNNFSVKTYIPNHKCHRKNTNPMATSKYLAKLLRERLMATPFIKQKDLKALCRTELKLKISLTQARNIREKVMADLLGSYADEYKRLHDYVKEINASNPGTTCIVKASKDEGGDINHFRSFYVCFDACKKGWTEGCRKIIGLDGCFLKGVCKGQLLCAVGRDGNNQMFPIAWAVVSIENKENWGWFLHLLKHDLSLGEGAELTVISDMQKGLDSAMNEHLPKVEHRMCARHIYAAWAKKWKGEERKIAFWNCARSTFENDLKNKLRELALLGNGIVEDVLRYDIESFSKVYFRTTPKCDAVDNNMAEAFNGWILEARCEPIISMLEEIRTQVMRRLYIRRRFCRNWLCDIGPRPMQKLEKNKELSFQWEMLWNGDDGYEVSNVYDHDNRYTVNLKSSSCTCREWDLTGIPCQHAISALYSAGLEPQNFIVHWYAKPTYLKAYQYMMQPVRGKILWDESGKEEIAPPPHKKLPGRPKVNRRKDKNEIQKISKLSRKGRVMHCKMCNQPGHNIRKCPMKTNMNAEINRKSAKRNNLDSTSWMNPSTDTEVNRKGMKKKVIKMNESKRGNSSAELVREFTEVKRGSTSQGQDKASSSQVQRASDQSSSQLKRPVNEVREGISCHGHNQHNHPGKRNRKPMKFGPRKLPTGYGRYVNEHTGQAILNPGTRYVKSFDKAHQAVVYSSEPQPVQDASKDVPGNENRTTSSLKWKGKAAMTTRQLLIEAQRKITAVTTQSNGRK